MSDYCKCPGIGCPVKNECYRFTSKPETFQSFFVRTPFEMYDDCQYFLMDFGPSLGPYEPIDLNADNRQAKQKRKKRNKEESES